MVVLILALAGCANTSTGLSSNPDQVDGQEGDAKVVITPTELTWTDLEVGYSYSQTFTLESVGDDDLLVYEIKIVADPLDGFVFDEVEDLVMPPGDLKDFPIVADLETDEPATGTLRIKTNDVDQLEVLIPLSASAAPADSGG